MKMKTLMTLALTVALTLTVFAGNRLNSEWEDLIKDENLKGWVVKNGEHKYEQSGSFSSHRSPPSGWAVLGRISRRGR